MDAHADSVLLVALQTERNILQNELHLTDEEASMTQLRLLSAERHAESSRLQFEDSHVEHIHETFFLRQSALLDALESQRQQNIQLEQKIAKFRSALQRKQISHQWMIESAAVLRRDMSVMLDQLQSKIAIARSEELSDKQTAAQQFQTKLFHKFYALDFLEAQYRLRAQHFQCANVLASTKEQDILESCRQRLSSLRAASEAAAQLRAERHEAIMDEDVVPHAIDAAEAKANALTATVECKASVSRRVDQVQSDSPDRSASKRNSNSSPVGAKFSPNVTSTRYFASPIEKKHSPKRQPPSAQKAFDSSEPPAEGDTLLQPQETPSRVGDTALITAPAAALLEAATPRGQDVPTNIPELSTLRPSDVKPQSSEETPRGTDRIFGLPSRGDHFLNADEERGSASRRSTPTQVRVAAAHDRATPLSFRPPPCVPATVERKGEKVESHVTTVAGKGSRPAPKNLFGTSFVPSRTLQDQTSTISRQPLRQVPPSQVAAAQTVPPRSSSAGNSRGHALKDGTPRRHQPLLSTFLSQSHNPKPLPQATARVGRQSSPHGGKAPPVEGPPLSLQPVKSSVSPDPQEPRQPSPTTASAQRSFLFSSNFSAFKANAPENASDAEQPIRPKAVIAKVVLPKKVATRAKPLLPSTDEHHIVSSQDAVNNNASGAAPGKASPYKMLPPPSISLLRRR